MSNIDNTKIITPSLDSIKDYTPVLKIGDEFFVNGVGGDYIPGAERVVTVYNPTAESQIEFTTPRNPTTDTNDEWIITASSNLNDSTHPYKAFTDSTAEGDDWHSASQGLPAWIQWRCTYKKVLVKSYFVRAPQRDGYTKLSPSAWKLQGSDDGETWTDIDSVTVEGGNSRGNTVTRLNLDNTTSYWYHRLYITEVDGSTSQSYATCNCIVATNSSEIYGVVPNRYDVRDATAIASDIRAGSVAYTKAGRTTGTWVMPTNPTVVSNAYYRCAVAGDTTTKKWSGYKATLVDGKYTFEKTLTSNLYYTVNCPRLGKIYTGDALVEVSGLYEGMPFSDMVFYAPLATATSTAVTGQPVEQYDTGSSHTPDHAVIDGIPCVHITNTGGGYKLYKVPQDSIKKDFPLYAQDRTLSVWIKVLSYQNSDVAFMGYGSGSSYRAFTFRLQSGKYGVDVYDDSVKSETVFDVMQWHCVTAVVKDKVLSIYVDGALSGSSEFANINTNISDSFYIGRSLGAWSAIWEGYLAAVRVYKYALSADEVAKLASEFTPTV